MTKGSGICSEQPTLQKKACLQWSATPQFWSPSSAGHQYLVPKLKEKNWHMLACITVCSKQKHPAGLFTVPRKHIIFYFAMAKPSFWTWNWYHRFFCFFVFFCVIHNPHSVLWPTTMRTQTTSFSRATFFHSLASHSRARVCPVTLNRFSPVFTRVKLQVWTCVKYVPKQSIP